MLQVESHYCGHCLENLASADARLRKNCCVNCNNCPVCSHVLSIRIAVITASTEDPSKSVTRKMYYLVCSFCRWTSRDVGLPDQTSVSTTFPAWEPRAPNCSPRPGIELRIPEKFLWLNRGGCVCACTSATGGWAEREVPNAQRISSLLECYKGMATRERHDKEKKKYVPRRSYLHFSDKFGLSTLLARKRAGLGSLSALGYKDDSTGLPELMPAVASEEVEQLPDDVFSESVDLSKVSTMRQRLAQVEVQPASVAELLPVHKPLLVKQSLRCRECEHNVSKPETSPSSTKFKIQLFAYYHVPEVRIVTCEPLRPGCPAELIIKLCNPTQHQTTLAFLPLPSHDEDQQEYEHLVQERRNKRDAEVKSTPGREDASMVIQSFTRQLSASEDPRPIKVQVTGDITLPECSVVLPPRDDAAEYDDAGDTHAFQDDPK
ncbi:hypothetical protein PR048_030910 [Dryococelus australis]|uniref:Dynactin subunit 4 n=1 Tax=Dryococelus australis TaxID=614101 RepID=A0ABQ9GA77_9NEOP|nr:hypothetical protein PR048_030910 [Dryococelus australis]